MKVVIQRVKSSKVEVKNKIIGQIDHGILVLIGIISVFFSPTLAKILATLLVVFVLLIRPNGLFGTAKV